MNYNDPRGAYQISRVLAALTTPMTIPQLAPALHLSEDGVRRYIKRLCAAKQIRVSGWQQTATGRVAPIYGLGGDPDAVYGEAICDRREACILAHLAECDHTSQQLAVKMGRCVTHVCAMMVSLRALKRVHVASYVEPEGRGSFTPVYALGDRADAPMRKKPTSARRKHRLEQNRDWKLRTAAIHATLLHATARQQNPFSALGL